jgi:hypothetical protein
LKNGTLVSAFVPASPVLLSSRIGKVLAIAIRTMSAARDAFGPNLRRLRLKRGVSLEQISATSKISIDLFKGLECNDFSRWPNGIYARSYMRAYAEAIGEDGDATVDEFCRWFPQGDRRVAKLIREQSAIVGHDDLAWGDDLGEVREERRSSGGTPPAPPSVPERVGSKVGRAIGVLERGLLGAVKRGFHMGSVRDLLKRQDLAVPQRKRQREI